MKITKFTSVGVRELDCRQIKRISGTDGSNREVRRHKVETLKKSFQDNGICGTIILAHTNVFNEGTDKQKYWYSVDGQHRLEAAIQLGLDPKEYFIFKAVPSEWTKEQILKYIGQINSTQSVFMTGDYINLYKKNPNYEILSKANQDYPSIGLGNLLPIFSRERGGKLKETYKNGEYQATSKRGFEICEIWNFIISDLKEKKLTARGINPMIEFFSERYEDNPKFTMTVTARQKFLKNLIKETKSSGFLIGSYHRMIKEFLDKMGIPKSKREIEEMKLELQKLEK